MKAPIVTTIVTKPDELITKIINKIMKKIYNKYTSKKI